MRLLDRKAEVSGLPARATERWVGPPVQAASASIRYVLDLAASNACGDLLRNGDGLFEPDNPLFRLPADRFWLELFEERDDHTFGQNRRLGYLVEAEPDGRSGTIIPFSETNEGLSRRLPCVLKFDLDRKMTSGPGVYTLRHPHLTHVAPLLEHALLQPDRDGLARLRTGPGAAPSVLTELAEATWYALPLMFAFVALLNSPQIVETRRSELHRLNRARQRRGRQPLLDHIEVRLALGDSAASGTANSLIRNAPRLHFVRGHVVRRDGKTFWRQPHLRGDSNRAIISKTVRVTAGRSVQRDAARHVRMNAAT